MKLVTGEENSHPRQPNSLPLSKRFSPEGLANSNDGRFSAPQGKSRFSSSSSAADFLTCPICPQFSDQMQRPGQTSVGRRLGSDRVQYRLPELRAPTARLCTVTLGRGVRNPVVPAIHSKRVTEGMGPKCLFRCIVKRATVTYLPTALATWPIRTAKGMVICVRIRVVAQNLHDQSRIV